MRSKLLAVLAALALTVVVGAAPAAANHSWSDYHWARTANPFTLTLRDTLSSADWKARLATASSDWSQSAVLDTTITPAAATGNCMTTTGTVTVCNKTYGFNGWLGLATIWINADHHIVKGSVKVNDTYFKTSRYNDPSAKQHVMCQEVGHTFGLGHQENNTGSCMDDVNGLFDPAFAHPNQHDYDQLVTIYSHTDSYTTVKAAAAVSAGASGRGEAEDAVPAGAGPQHGRVFARDLGGGHFMITFVTWAR